MISLMCVLYSEGECLCVCLGLVFSYDFSTSYDVVGAFFVNCVIICFLFF